ncbi:MAG: zinc ribbon domain-containing protein [Deltaproteobacteria bacterium]|nr:zinc ribbon domain-containing protein [Deltaproteobacteria bacterium]
MPIYEYKCNKCGKTIEAWQKFSDAPLTQCKCCDGELHKLISMSTFHLKGSGWYTTDYAGKNQSTSSSSSSDASKSEKSDKKDAGSKE